MSFYLSLVLSIIIFFVLVLIGESELALGRVKVK